MYDQLVRFLLLCEGSSDTALVPHLRRLLSHCGAAEVVGTAIALVTVRGGPRRRGAALERKIRAVLSVDTEFDLLFIHRDSDGAGYEQRLREILEAVRGAGVEVEGIPIIPIRATEAWILLNEEAIRRVAGNPRGRHPLKLPRPRRVEQLSEPKRLLEDALVAACGHQGLRLKKFRSKFGQHRRILLEQLPVGGALDEVPSWVRLKAAVLDVVSRSTPSGES